MDSSILSTNCYKSATVQTDDAKIDLVKMLNVGLVVLLFVCSNGERKDSYTPYLISSYDALV